MKIIALLLALVLYSGITNAQPCITGEGNIFNETVFIGLEAVADLDPASTIVARASAGCVGSASVVPSPGATAIALTVWHDYVLTPEIDGVQPGEEYRVYNRSVDGGLYPLVYSLAHETDGISALMEAVFDTTTTALLDSIFATISLLELRLDSVYTADSTTIATQATQITTLETDNLQLADNLQLSRDSSDVWETRAFAHQTSRDSLQVIIDTFPDAAEIAALRDDLDNANARVVVLEAESAAWNTQLRNIVDAIRRMWENANR